MNDHEKYLVRLGLGAGLLLGAAMGADLVALAWILL